MLGLRYFRGSPPFPEDEGTPQITESPCAHGQACKVSPMGGISGERRLAAISGPKITDAH